MIKPILSIFAVLSARGAHHLPAKNYAAVATFANNGIVGNVTILEGELTFDLDFSGITWSDLPDGINCSDGGFKHHIHTIWGHSSNDDQIGSVMCNSTWTSGHYDPWQGCGSASANPYCWKSTTSANKACINVSDYSCNMGDNPFLCEVGDWSSKYGLLSLDSDDVISESFESFYEVQAMDVEDMSIVFHCNAGQRAFCAPFIINETMDDQDVPAQDEDETGYATFDLLGEDSMIMLMADGTVEMFLDSTDIDLDDYSCTDYDITVWNDWDSKDYSLLGDDCEDAIGKQYDPTRQCFGWSEMTEFCDNNMLCGNYTYDCDFGNERYSCAPGDLSGKFGMYKDADSDIHEEMVSSENSLIPRTEDMIGEMSVVIHCPYEAGEDIEILACAGIMKKACTDCWDDGVATCSYFAAVAVSLVAFFFSK